MITGLSCYISCERLAKKYGPEQQGGVESDTSLTKTENRYLAELETYRKTSQAQIVQHRKQLAEISTRINKDNPINKAEYLAEIADLKLINDELETKLLDYHPNGLKHWETFRDQTLHDLDQINQSLTDLSVE